VLVETVLFQIWTWTQAIGFEASAGVVLAAALDAHRNRDAVKRTVLLLLMGGLALVGTTMLVMAFVEASTSFKEQDLPTAYSITMSVLRGIVSVAYVTVGRVKNRRFSGPDVVSVATVPDLLAHVSDIRERSLPLRVERRQLRRDRAGVPDPAIVRRRAIVPAARDQREAALRGLGERARERHRSIRVAAGSHRGGQSPREPGVAVDDRRREDGELDVGCQVPDADSDPGPLVVIKEPPTDGMVNSVEVEPA